MTVAVVAVLVVRGSCCPDFDHHKGALRHVHLLLLLLVLVVVLVVDAVVVVCLWYQWPIKEL